ncbi:MAG: SGNH/GDSL hydrolase family protein [Clostridia bacterium]|nr:SGNH/GDSL hydrolase family protein [Clostridia bacterium]
MDINYYLGKIADEKPLDNIVEDGGFTSIFRTIAVVGDSLSSGELESKDAGGPCGYHDIFDISWGQYLARMSGTKVYNFSRGGMTASEYCNSFAEAMGYWDRSKAAMAYIIALGCNDLDGLQQPVGSIDDVKDNLHLNSDTFAGHYGKIIQQYKKIQPDAAFFLVTMPRDSFEEQHPEVKERHEGQRRLMHAMAERFTNTYVIDLREYAPFYGDEFRKAFFVGGHMNSQGYYLTARMIGSYIDYIVRHNPDKFSQAGFIGTPFAYVN